MSRRPIRWAGVALGGWCALAMLLFAQSLWEIPSYMADWLPGPYRMVAAWFPPGWIGASREGGGRVAAVLLYAVITAGLWAAYLAALRTARHSDLAAPSPVEGRGIGWGVVFGAVAITWPGLLASDLYLYATYGKMQVVYGLNPLVQPPSAMTGDPWLVWAPWHDILSAYGPVWLVITRGVSAVAVALGGDRALYLLGFKLLNLALLAGGAALVATIGRQLAWPAGRRLEAVLLFAWCPLGIIEWIGNGHNDALLAVCALAALWLHLRGQWPAALVALLAGGLVKLPGLFLLPAYVTLLLVSAPDRAARARRGLAGVVVGGTFVVLAYAPYADPALGKVLLANPVAGFYAASPALVVRQLLTDAALALRGVLTPATLTERGALEAVRWPVWYAAYGGWALLALLLSVRVRDA
ncbi:MAG TPA: hypothetical protein VM536_11945, partial [Chloroflexia bacterium]|nr:hypothetical protein [Chloroflexia bacterium]